MKTVYALAAIPIIAGALGACGDQHPPPAVDPPIVVTGPVPQPGISPALQPDFGPVVHQNEAPPPISGGTLVIARDGGTAIAADPDRDRVYIVDVPGRAVRHTVQLARHSEPGRVAVDEAGRAYVVLRRSGGLATIDLATGTATIRDVCVAPRGLAYDANLLAIHVACASGELVTLPVGEGAALRRRELDHDLRDVIMQSDGSMVVTTFRSASKIRLASDGTPLGSSAPFNVNLAWRTVAMAATCKESDCSDATAVVEQTPTNKEVSTGRGGYGGSTDTFDPMRESSACGPMPGIITTQLRFGRGSVDLPLAVLPVDLATNGREFAVVAAGNAFTQQLPQIIVVKADDVKTPGFCAPTAHGKVPGQAVAAAFDGSDALIVQTREPAALHIMSTDRRVSATTIKLSDDSVADTGHAIFHANAGGFIACASCHAEGADDGHVWSFDGIGPRRTPSLLGTVAGTEPFHWDGDQKNMRDLVDHVFVERMSGPQVEGPQLGALNGWLFAQPGPTKLRTPSETTARGETLFQQHCTSCHSGSMLTNNATVDVGTGGKFQVPSLIGVGWRRPLIHSGCAQTLTERFDPGCGGSRHGDTLTMSAAEIGDLVQYLETL